MRSSSSSTTNCYFRPAGRPVSGCLVHDLSPKHRRAAVGRNRKRSVRGCTPPASSPFLLPIFQPQPERPSSLVVVRGQPLAQEVEHSGASTSSCTDSRQGIGPRTLEAAAGGLAGSCRCILVFVSSELELCVGRLSSGSAKAHALPMHCQCNAMCVALLVRRQGCEAGGGPWGGEQL